MNKNSFIGGLGGVTVLMFLAGCNLPPPGEGERASADVSSTTAASEQVETIGEIRPVDPAFEQLVPPDAEIQKLASGFEWSEGPVWLPSQNAVVFSDVPQNVVFKWTEENGIETFLEQSGYTGSAAGIGGSGSNGLTLDSQGRLVVAQHGDRQIARIGPEGDREVLAEFYRWRRFNSPNDLVYKSNGDLYFTDPPYGLPDQDNDPRKELTFNGVFRLSTDGEVTLLTAELSRPNGIAFSPDEKTLYVANSDPDNAIWTAYDVQPDGTIANGRILFDATDRVPDNQGLPDGLKVDQNGNLFATGPGGVLVLSPAGEHLGTIRPGVAAANCAWGNDGSVLYITAHMHLCRVKTTTRGAGF